jgi:hypothetical protein
MHHDVRQTIRRRHIIALSHQPQPIGNAAAGRLLLQLPGVVVAPLMRAHQHGHHVAAAEPDNRVQ